MRRAPETFRTFRATGGTQPSQKQRGPVAPRNGDRDGVRGACDASDHALFAALFIARYLLAAEPDTTHGTHGHDRRAPEGAIPSHFSASGMCGSSRWTPPWRADSLRLSRNVWFCFARRTTHAAWGLVGCCVSLYRTPVRSVKSYLRTFRRSWRRRGCAGAGPLVAGRLGCSDQTPQ
jgi:hypothetical protein